MSPTDNSTRPLTPLEEKNYVLPYQKDLLEMSFPFMGVANTSSSRGNLRKMINKYFYHLHKSGVVPFKIYCEVKQEKFDTIKVSYLTKAKHCSLPIHSYNTTDHFENEDKNEDEDEDDIDVEDRSLSNYTNEELLEELRKRLEYQEE